MRIIGGKHGSRKIEFPICESVRPTADMVRQALFTKLQFEIADSSFLDLFAGSGSVGLEAISRNARKVVFVEKNRDCVSIINKNLKSLKEDAQVFHGDFKNYLASSNCVFDFIFIDPPYDSGLYFDALKLIFERKLLSESGVIICECECEFFFEQNLFFEFDKKKYGKKCLYFLKNM